MKKVTMFSKATCPYCIRAQKLLTERGVTNLEIISIDTNRELRAVMIERTGRTTVPQIFIGEKHVGGCDDLMALDRAGELTALLAD
ncbi:glutaredoxin 3 [Advenella sp. WQ 585]|jgi:glutaredoxin 3|uniref:Glutaredoxin n=1 Tax=Advenella mandrilli TaxID=2800330 RepID=A0ABS1EB00_9BURK|nr:glutaredoxin 3 [Advenella mandrilli]MBK1780726.1 glutaredoxin 3 [Advenella mandrilli]MDY0270937.1 glutaredoxin 3 [Advenella sp.]